jgi:replication fork protection complex subunit Tof1/Swi1
VLGDDALACLRDLKRWLKLYDEKANRLDVARCLAESNLVGGDLLQILATWPENATDDKLKSKIALACLELLVPLTWPIERLGSEMTVNHHRHVPYLQLAQLGYKRSIINFDGARILHTAVRVALPSMAEAQGERSTRDVGIIKLVLYFFRNIAMIAPPPNVEYDGDEAEISRSATIDAFDYQDIFQLLLTMSSTMGEDFSQQDVTVMEVIFHLIKGVDIEKLFMNEEQLDNRKVDELVGLRNQEAGMKRSYARTAPTRHNRFGTMIWVKRDDARVSSVSGQDALLDGGRSLAKMDKAKKFNPPRRVWKGENGPLNFDTPVPLNVRAQKSLRAFVEDFLDSGFNPLFQHIRKAIDREAERVLPYHERQFFYLVAWFLEAERVRRKSKKSKYSKKGLTGEESDSFALVASVLNQEMFITLNRAMDAAYETKAWQDLNAAMKCFTQILLTVQEMSESELEEDQEIAENILARIFYEETTHDRVANIIRYYKDQGFGYLDSCTELAHVYLRILEHYSKQNTDLQVRSRRRIRRKRKAAKELVEDGENVDDVDESDGEDEARAERTSNERKFDFKRFAARFLSQGCVDTFVTFCTYFLDLTPEQLKRAHRFFYRVAFKMEMSVMLFRIDIIALFYKMIKGPEGLDPKSPMFKEWDEMVRQLIKRCTRKIQERPQLIVELLFSKTNGIAHYLEYGYEKQTITTKPRAAAELEVKPGMEWEQQIGVVVSALLDRNQGDLLEWVKSQLSTAEVERRAWERANTAVPSVESGTNDKGGDQPQVTPEAPKAPSIRKSLKKVVVTTSNICLVVQARSDVVKAAMFKNGHLRLLMTLVGFQRIGADDEPGSPWMIPSNLSADQLKQSLDLIKQNEFNPPIFDDGKEAEDLIRRKSASTGARRRTAFDDESDNAIDSEEEFLFPAGGPTAMKKSAALEALKKTRRRRKSGSSEEEGGLTDEQRKIRADARRARELEKLRKIKSDLYIHDSDEESDEEKDLAFFEQEEKLRQRTALQHLLGIQKSKDESAPKQKPMNGGIKRRAREISSDSDSDIDDIQRTRHHSSSARDDDQSGSEATDTPLSSSPHIRSSQTKRLRISSEQVPSRSASPENTDDEASVTGPDKLMRDVPALSGQGGEVNDDEEDNDIPVVRTMARRRVTSGFIIESSDEE